MAHEHHCVLVPLLSLAAEHLHDFQWLNAKPGNAMNSDNILLLGLNQSVTAISKHDGQTLWKTELPTILSGDDFVTMLSDGLFVFAHTEGKLHCLDLANGHLIWSNDL